MVPVYSILSLCALAYGMPKALWFEIARDCYGAKSVQRTVYSAPRALSPLAGGLPSTAPPSVVAGSANSAESWIIYNFLALMFSFSGAPAAQRLP